jgi:8-oxo-dGTP pyrophosphatase MutT (NUDIX family)
MANAYVFPGGRLDPADLDASLVTASQGLDRDGAQARLGDVGGAEAFGLYMAALRETFEEAGVLLADGPVVSAEDSARWRDSLQEGAATLAEMVRATGITLRPDRLLYWDHWITPPVEKHRYDARFFVAAVEPDLEAAHDDKETTDGVWMSPAEAIARYAAGAFQLAPPQVRILHDLRRYPDADAVLAAAQGRGPIPGILPEPLFVEGKLFLLLPGDQGHSASAPGTTTLHRATLDGGLWTLVDTRS